MNGHKIGVTKLTGEVNLGSANIPRHIMLHSITQKLLLGLTLTALAFSVPAADNNYTPENKKAATPTTLNGRVVFVDKSLRAVAVEVRGKVIQVNVLSFVKVVKGGKIVTFDELAAGQEVTITFRETVQGHLEVVALSIEGSANQAEAAKQPDPKPGRRVGPPDQFPGNGNPANFGGPVHSPNH